ncbi:MAG: type II secretion system F family protein [Clostridia bacterium]|nr:type II secretion system F family protein [Clostridiales bacterium]MCR5804849.1 type II secretion system F family protein [Clostridia bacterium]
MPKFKYEVVDAKGKMSTGFIEAGNVNDASRLLKADGKFIASIKADTGSSILNAEVGSPRLKTKDLVIISRQLASLLSAGITIIRALDMLYQQVESKKAKNCVGAIYESIQSGKTLSEAFKEQSAALPSIMVTMVSAGEESGKLDEVMARLAEHFAKEAKLKNKVSSALVYPKILGFVTAAVTLGLMIFVVPKLSDTINELGGELPGLTKAVMNFSHSLVHFWYIYALIVAAIVISFKVWKKSESGSITWAKLMLKIPIVGKSTKMTAAARFTRTMSTLLRSGISVLQAVEITGATLDNKILEKKLYDARIDIRKGTNLSKAIRPIKEFPPMIYAMVSIGEESGTLDSILDKAADFFEDEADAATAKLTSAIEPVMIIIMAVVVGTVVGAVGLPIFKMASFIHV